MFADNQKKVKSTRKVSNTHFILRLNFAGTAIYAALAFLIFSNKKSSLCQKIILQFFNMTQFSNFSVAGFHSFSYVLFGAIGRHTG